MTDIPPSDSIEPKDSGKASMITRAGIVAIAGAIPFAGGLLSAIAGVWGEKEQKQANDFLKGWLKMLEDELHEKQRIITEIVSRVDLHDEEISRRICSDEYQSLLRKTFRNWAGAESRKKQEYIRNVLSNAASSKIVSRVYAQLAE